jgi:FG-GAP-like repeat
MSCKTETVFLGKGRLTPFCLSLILLLLFAGFGTVPACAQTMQFVQVASFTPSLSPAYVLTGDLNRDGKPDLVIVSNEGTGIPSSAYVLLGKGDGSFGPAYSYPVGTAGNSQPGQPTLADLRGDGNLDLIVPSEVSNVVNVLLGKGDGSFLPAVSYPTSLPSVTGVTAGDFNGDNKVDLAVADFETVHGGFAANVDVLPGNGDGAFGAPISTALGQDGITNSIVSGDFNRDGDLDIAGAVGLQILLGNGNGTFQQGATYPVGAFDIVAADFNGDGVLDLATTNGTQVNILLGNGDGTFKTPTSYAVGGFGIAAVDMNSDGKIDLAVATSSGFSVLLGNGDGTFTLGAAVPVNQVDQPSIAVADFKTGGLPGVAINTRTSVLVLLQGPLPTLSSSPTVLNFAPQVPGTISSAQTVTLTNSGTATLSLSGLAISGADATGFAQTNNCAPTLAAKASCQIKVTSTPGTAGTQTASLNITDNAPGSPQTVALNGTGSDFSLGVTSQTNITVTPGQAANYSVVVSAVSGFNQTADLSCSGIPPQSTCTVTPSSIAPGAAANLAVVTTAASAGLTQPAGGPSADNPFGWWAALSGLLGLALLLGADRYRRERHPQMLYGLTFACLLSVGIAMSACGGGSGNGGTPVGTYSPVVTGTFTSGSAKLTHTVKVTLVVQ